MSALKQLERIEPYNKRVTFEVHGISSEKGSKANQSYDWKGQGHGLVILDNGGKMLQVIPGHSYGRTEIVTALDGHLN